ncbi:MAG TPA: O-antigen ligase family protein [Anaeromyxobacteraceae bacterium]|nr:O-antigen ligase family protein [Anaeromyxobacteraceae bacterium]
MSDAIMTSPAAFPGGAAVRDAGLSRAADRWGRLAYVAALGFVVQLYASPAFYWPELFEPLRLGVVSSTLCTLAVVMRRVTSGERLRMGGPPAAFLFAYAMTVPLSLVWTISPLRTHEAMVDMAKLAILYVTLLNALDTPARLRTFLVVGALATLAPSVGGIQRWLDDDRLIEGYRTAWRGNYADPNRLAMGLVLFLPVALAMAGEVKRRWVQVALLVATGCSMTCIILTHSRSGSIAMAVSLALVLLRGRRKGRGLLLGALALVCVVSFAPQSFWTRTESIADFEEDASVAGRQRAWEMLKVIVDERPLSGVGAGAFIDAWDRFAPMRAGGQHLIAHNIFMEIVGEQGLLALALFGVFCLWLTVRLWQAGGDGPGSTESRALLAGLSGYLVCELVNGYSRAFNLYVGFAAAVAAIVLARARARLAREADAPSVGAAA